MSDELKAIQERHDDWEEIGFVRMGPTGAIQCHKDRATLLPLAERAAELEADAAFARFVLRWLFHKEGENPKQFRDLVINHPHAQDHVRTLKGAPDGR